MTSLFYENLLIYSNTFMFQETDVQYEFTEKESFGELNHILDCLRNKDLEPALVWATAHSQALDNINSSLEFKLHRLKYIELLSKGTNYQADAITYARNHFRKFVKQHEKGKLLMFKFS